MKKVDFFDAIYDNKPEIVKENFDSLDQEGKASVFYFACGHGALDLVKWMMNNPNFIFDNRLHGCSKEEYGFQAACHKEGKTVRHYLVKECNLTLSDSMVSWMYENKLGRLMPKKRKIS
jgi:hypothetical protein